MRSHRTLERNGVIALELTDGEYSGIIFSYGGVRFEENEARDNLKVHFDYEIHEGEDKLKDKVAFEKDLGDFIIEMIIDGIEKNNLVYKGGIDENREDDIIESDPQ
jgi:hypothetical protein